MKVQIKEKPLLLILLTGIVFLVVSLRLVGFSFENLHNRTIVQIFLFVLPTLYAFFAINIYSKEDIIRILKITTIVLLIAYFFEEGHSLNQFFNIQNWLRINIFNSTSFTESNLCARAFTILFLFFNYIYWTDKKQKITPYLIVCFIFSVLCFKRIDIIVTLITFLISRFITFNRRVKNKTVVIVSILLVLFTILYLNLINGNISTNIDITKFTSGRNRKLALWANTEYYSYGYGTSMIVINRYLELDLIQIYLELNIFCLAIFIFSYLYISKNSIYSFGIMIYVLLNMLFASSLANTLSWVILIISIAYISNDSCDGSKFIIKEKLDNKTDDFMEATQ